MYFNINKFFMDLIKFESLYFNRLNIQLNENKSRQILHV